MAKKKDLNRYPKEEPPGVATREHSQEPYNVSLDESKTDNYYKYIEQDTKDKQDNFLDSNLPAQSMKISHNRSSTPPNIPDLSPIKSSYDVWEHAISVLMKLAKEHPEGIAMRAWVSTQHMEDMEQLYTWNESLFQTCTEATSYYLHSKDKDKKYLSTNSTLGLLMLWKFLHHHV